MAVAKGPQKRASTKRVTKAKKKKKILPGRVTAKLKKPKPCNIKSVCEFLEEITTNTDLPLPAGTTPSDLPWLVSFYYGYMDLYYAVVRLERIHQGLPVGPPILSGPGGDKAGAPPPPKFPPD